jgi:hypothetical protein
MKALAYSGFDPRLPLQTKAGAKEALRCGHNKVDDLIRQGKLKVIYFDRIPKITTDSILAVAQGDAA